MADLNRKIGEVDQDNLITDVYPRPLIGHATIRKESSAEKTYKRGTVLALDSSDNMCVILAEGETLTANCILCDDVTVGTDADVTVPVYIAGCFAPDKVIVGDEYTMKPADYDALRQYGIIFKAAYSAYSKKPED